ncbi:hypothetical protein PHMEG_00016614 [Phytophthora megakarya]|uniref:Uncharacterized protein n=1 Tax=Phytophthora megakarya TaxID=4795 RepID=A0A225VZY1_9STRA|nr:hypothetical protein PHMEG_00016614 [Phytophthora megakarya]
MRKVYDGSWSPFNNDPWSIHRGVNTTQHGNSGRRSATESDVFHGCPRMTKSHGPLDWFSLSLSDVYAGFEPVISPGHATAFAELSRISPPTTPRTPVSRSMLDWIAANIDYKKPKHRLKLRLFLAVKGGRHNYALEVRDVEVLDITGPPAVNLDKATHAVITLRGSKTDKEGQGSSRYLNRSGDPRACRVVGAALLLELATRNKLRPTDSIRLFNQST